MPQREPGELFRRRRPARSPEEEVADGLYDVFKADVTYLYRIIAPKGLGPGQVPLNRAERQKRLMEATEADWRKWREQIEANPDEKERNKALGDLFEKWSVTEMTKRDQKAQGGQP